MSWWEKADGNVRYGSVCLSALDLGQTVLRDAIPLA
jgi:hypothetical protein